MRESERFDSMATELERLERQGSFDDYYVSTREDETHVTLIYKHEEDNDGE